MLVALAVFLLGHGQLDTQTNPQTQLHAIPCTADADMRNYSHVAVHSRRAVLTSQLLGYKNSITLYFFEL